MAVTVLAALSGGPEAAAADASWVEASLIEVGAGPVAAAADPSSAPRRFDRDPARTRELNERHRSEKVGARQRDFIAREAGEARGRLEEWRAAHAKELEDRQARMERFRAQIREKAKAGGDPWWLKDLPWWMPSPPEWGPLPATMYTAYFHKPTGKPLDTPNYGPGLFRSAENLEPPAGQHSPLPSNGGPGNGGPTSGDVTNTGDHTPGSTPRADTPSPEGKQVEDALAAGPSFLEVPPTAQHPEADNPDFWKPHFAPTTIAERMPDRVSYRVPPHVRYDTSMAPAARPYADYWRRWYAAGRPGYRPYRFVSAPAYPPPMGEIRARVAAHLRDGPPHAPIERSPAYFPSRYEEPTGQQVRRANELAAQEGDELPQPF